MSEDETDWNAVADANYAEWRADEEREKFEKLTEYANIFSNLLIGVRMTANDMPQSLVKEIDFALAKWDELKLELED